MAEPTGTPLCPDEDLSALLQIIETDERQGRDSLDTVLRRYPEDPRLHFLRGSLLAAGRDYQEARIAMRRAVDLAPDYAIARFQLGFLLLTCGEPYAAQEAWGPLHGRPVDDYLRIFATGLAHLIRDEFAEADERLREGMRRNAENPALNGDMQRILDEMKDRIFEARGGEEPLSSAQLLLQQSAFKATRH